jgi:NAD(P)H-dependent flavin oxidoreductase YrpB (nitropropane dioxygenase family)
MQASLGSKLPHNQRCRVSIGSVTEYHFPHSTTPQSISTCSSRSPIPNLTLLNHLEPSLSNVSTRTATMAAHGPLTTPLTTLLNIKHPILLAGMARTSGGPLAAAVSNAGGLGCIGGLGYTPTQLREIIHELKANLTSPSLSFGVDLALPKVGEGARKTNHDYTHGQLDELITVTIEEGAKLFISAVGIPPPHVIKGLHDAGILVMNMVGAPKHAKKALDAGVDIVCAQGGEGGGHTGDIPNSILIPSVVDVARQYRPKLLGGQPALVVAAGGIYNGRSLASSLMQGATGVWVGTRFVASKEAGCSQAHKESVVSATLEDTIRTLVVSGRPLRCKRNEWTDKWEAQPQKIKELTEKGVVPIEFDMEAGNDVDIPHLMGIVAGVVDEIKPAGKIVDEMVSEAVQMLKKGQTYLTATQSRL